MMRSFFQNKDGQFVIWQMPNLPLWLWIVCYGLSFAFLGPAHLILNGIGALALIIWAVMEMLSGESLFRHYLGGVVLAVELFGLIKLLVKH